MKRLPVGFACEFACCGVISREEFVVPTLIHRAALSSAPNRVGRRNRYEKLSRFILSDLARHGFKRIERKTPSLSASQLPVACRFGRHFQQADHGKTELVRARDGGPDW